MSILIHKTRRIYKPATGGYVFFRIKNKPRFILYVKIHAFCSLLGHILAIFHFFIFFSFFVEKNRRNDAFGCILRLSKLVSPHENLRTKWLKKKKSI